MKHHLLCLSLLTTACSGGRIETRTAPPVPPEVTTRGDTIYFGTVFPLHGAGTPPTYVYERRVEAVGGGLRSSHITRDPQGSIALAESATHDLDYRLSSYLLHANQLGQSGSVEVVGEEVRFRLEGGGQVEQASETQQDPVVVGPTLVGYIVRHLEALRSGQELPVRMAVLDRLETIGFRLSAIPGEAGQTRIRMTASSFLYGLFIDPIDFDFEASSGKLVRLEGRVPPKVWADNRWRDFDARVEYRFVAGSYL